MADRPDRGAEAANAFVLDANSATPDGAEITGIFIHGQPGWTYIERGSFRAEEATGKFCAQVKSGATLTSFLHEVAAYLLGEPAPQAAPAVMSSAGTSGNPGATGNPGKVTPFKKPKPKT